MFSSKIKSKSRRKSSKSNGNNATATIIRLTKGHADNDKKFQLPSMSMSISRKPIIYIAQTSTSPRMGLTPKEKSYLISSCQRHSGRYAKLKSLALDAMKNNKVFIVYGNNGVIRRAMKIRGWLEKIPPNSMNLSRLQRSGATKTDINNELERLLLSNFFEKHTPNFMWKVKDTGRQSLDMNEFNNTIINKLRIDTVWATKQGLCSSMKNKNWFHIERIAETHTPRTYSSSDKDDVDEFTADYTFTACTGLLNWFLKMERKERAIFTKTGTVPKNVLVFALNRCKEFLLSKQNKDIDHNCRSISTKIWNIFLNNYYKLVSDEESFEEDIERNVPLYAAYAKILLMEILKYRPQIKCEGFHNIWIVKPGHCSRGRGIKLASNLTQINHLLSKSSQKQVIQKYIEEPLLIHETKFDIRQYYLVTSTFPLIIWMYKDCYLKFSSQKYSLSDYNESIHLTNHAVQRKYKNCQGRHPDLPSNNMWSLETYKDYLKMSNKTQVWEEIIYPGMKKCIIGVMLSCQDRMSACQNRFELYGCDFVLDGDYKPWLIEINSCPDLNPTTRVTARICSAVVEDIVKVVIDRPEWIKANTGQFECAYRQPITTPIYRSTAELLVRGCGLPNDYFCKSTIVHDPFDSSVDIERECDILDTFKQLKALYAEDNTIKSEVEANESEEELDQAAQAINSRLNVMLGSVPSAASVDTISTNKSSGTSSSISIRESLGSPNYHISDTTSENDTSLRGYFSGIELTTTIDKSISIKRSSSLALLKKRFEYNIEELSSLNVAERIIHSMSRKLTTAAHSHLLTGRYISTEVVVLPECNLENQKKLPTAASKILNFITEKQKMYSN